MGEKIDKIGKWSESKLISLKKYLEPYATIMNSPKQKKWCKNFYYIDAFAGSGKPTSKDEKIFIDGSPLCALKIKNQFSGYIFIEKENWRISRLELLKQEFPKLKIEIIQGDCNEILLNDIFSIFAPNERIFLFLDPFGMSINWEIIDKAAKKKNIEILLNLPIMAINRAVLWKEGDRLTEKQKVLMDKLCGNKDWLKKFYIERPTLFNNKVKEKRPITAEELSNWFKSELSKIFEYVSNPIFMKNSKNTTLYSLILASHNPTGVRIFNSTKH